MSMFEVSRVSAEIGDSEISFETGKLAKQASGSVVVRAGDTMVLCTATMGGLREVDFLPLTVDVEERMYAAGKIPGSFFRREGRSGEKATLTARMIDRPRAKAGKEKLEIDEPTVDEGLFDQIRASHGAKIDEATQIPEKLARQDAATAVEEEVLEQYAPDDGEDPDPDRRAEVAAAF